MKWLSSVCLALLALASLVIAQEQPRATPRGDDARALRDEVDEVRDAYLLMKVQERLDLTDEQMLRAMPLIRRHHQTRRDVEHRRFHLLRELRELFASGAATEERVSPLLRELKGVEAERLTTLRQSAEAIDAMLSPIQQAKYRLLEVEIERRLRELRHRARQRVGGPDGLDDRATPGPDVGPRPRRH
jgi:hypothetical protein